VLEMSFPTYPLTGLSRWRLLPGETCRDYAALPAVSWSLCGLAAASLPLIILPGARAESAGPTECGPAIDRRLRRRRLYG
jgi:hypothetical protein